MLQKKPENTGNTTVREGCGKLIGGVKGGRSVTENPHKKIVRKRENHGKIISDASVGITQ